MEKQTAEGHRVKKLVKTNDNKIVSIGDDKSVNVYY